MKLALTSFITGTLAIFGLGFIGGAITIWTLFVMPRISDEARQDERISRLEGQAQILGNYNAIDDAYHALQSDRPQIFPQIIADQQARDTVKNDTTQGVEK